MAKWTLLANRIGYLLVAVSIATFVIGFAIGFSGAVAAIVIVSMVAGFVLLAPSIVLGYAVKAAERDDREHDLRLRLRGCAARRLPFGNRMAPRLPASARREQILDVAVQVFARNGFHGTSMNDVAEAAGVTKPVLYQHFVSKQELHLALLDEVGRRLLAAISKATAGATSGREMTELGFRAYFRFVAHDHDAFRLLYGTGASRDDEATAAVRRLTAEAAAGISPLIAVDVDPVQRRVLAQGLVGMAEGVSRYLVELGGGFDPDLIGQQVADLAWAGLRSVQPH